MQIARIPLQIIFQALLMRGSSLKNQNQVGFHLYQKHLLFLVTTSKLKTTMYF